MQTKAHRSWNTTAASKIVSVLKGHLGHNQGHLGHKYNKITSIQVPKVSFNIYPRVHTFAKEMSSSKLTALMPIWIIGSVLAGMHAMAILMSRYWLRHAMPGWHATETWIATSSLGRRIASARNGRQGLPYAAYLAVGAVVTVFTPALLHW